MATFQEVQSKLSALSVSVDQKSADIKSQIQVLNDQITDLKNQIAANGQDQIDAISAQVDEIQAKVDALS
jgi:outer membrane murein-binding lipoprotein Lpp